MAKEKIENFFNQESSFEDSFWGEVKIRREAIRLFSEAFYLGQTIPMKTFIESLEKDIIFNMLVKVNGNQKEVARLLGMKYTTLNQKIKKYGINFKKKPFLSIEAI